MVAERRRRDARGKTQGRRGAREDGGREKKGVQGLIGCIVLLFLFYFAGSAFLAWVGESSSSAVPGDVTYTVIDTDVIPGMKRSLDIRISHRVSEEVLRSIALELKGRDPREYERTFISYYLPGQRVGAGGWATTHFNPTLEVLILGFTNEQMESLVDEGDDSSREVLGKWFWESPVGGRVSLYRRDGNLCIELKHKDGSISNWEVVEKTSPSGRRLEETGGSSRGEYFLVDRQGDLQIRDQEGLIATATKIE